jgi:hypothetical protein
MTGPAGTCPVPGTGGVRKQPAAPGEAAGVVGRRLVRTTADPALDSAPGTNYKRATYGLGIRIRAGLEEPGRLTQRPC